ncbi:hypothetical protein E2C01_050273 [Portunus trituberculatus]|uniref:Uncharacterized protein n=1 Tax=Portunus trituberculatus TaxID=210409 RepID=A0A5B7G7T9_PORTR|nr:hypothetical protein [Portunus trituberculatus]
MQLSNGDDLCSKPWPHHLRNESSLARELQQFFFQENTQFPVHAHGTGHLGKVTTRHHSGWLVVDAHLEPSGTPVHKLDGPFGFDGGNGCIDILGHHITTVQQAAGHVLAMSWVTLHHLVGRLKAGIGNFCYGQLFMVGLLRGNHRCIGDQGEVDPRIGNQVCLELRQIYIEGTVKSKRGSNGRDDLANKPVEIGVRWALNVKVPAADIVDGLIVNHEGTVGVFEGGVGGQDGVVRLNNSSGNLRTKLHSISKECFWCYLHLKKHELVT